MRKHRYAIYFTWNDRFDDVYSTWIDGSEDVVEVESKAERDFNIKNMLNSKEFKKISYCKIYHNGEYGVWKKVL